MPAQPRFSLFVRSEVAFFLPPTLQSWLVLQCSPSYNPFVTPTHISLSGYIQTSMLLVRRRSTNLSRLVRLQSWRAGASGTQHHARWDHRAHRGHSAPCWCALTVCICSGLCACCDGTAWCTSRLWRAVVPGASVAGIGHLLCCSWVGVRARSSRKHSKVSKIACIKAKWSIWLCLISDCVGPSRISLDLTANYLQYILQPLNPPFCDWLDITCPCSLTILNEIYQTAHRRVVIGSS